MGYLEETLRRSNLQSLREYLLYGVSEDNYSAKSYEVRLKKAFEKWDKVIAECGSKKKRTKLESVFMEVLAEYQHVYMEMGIQSGFQLAREIEYSDEEGSINTAYKEMYSSLFADTAKVIQDLQTAQKTAEEMYLSFNESLSPSIQE